jgi:hypothetical protein
MKTGTKFIQHLLRAASQKLCESGLSVPPPTVCHAGAAAAIHAAALEHLELDPQLHPDLESVFHAGAMSDLLGWLDATAAPAVLSSEALSWFSRDEAERWAEAVGGIRTVLVGVRNYRELCRSAWGAAVRRRRCGDRYAVFQLKFTRAVAARSRRLDWRDASANRADRLEYFSVPSTVNAWSGACDEIQLISADDMTDDSLTYGLIAALGTEHGDLLHLDFAALMRELESDARAIRHPGPDTDEIHRFLAANRGGSGRAGDAPAFNGDGVCSCDDCRTDPSLDATLEQLYRADLAFLKSNSG